MKLDLEMYLEKIFFFFDEEESTNLQNTFESLEFKYNKSLYHLENIKNKEEQANNLEIENYYENIYYPIYYEVESFLIAIRSTVDITLHLINEAFSLNIEKHNVYLSSVYKNGNLPGPVRNILKKYTHNRDNSTWSFIYTYRNELVHEKSVNQSLPINVDLFSQEKPIAYFELEGQTKNLVRYFSNCLELLRRFIIHMLEAVHISLDLLHGKKEFD